MNAAIRLAIVAGGAVGTLLRWTLSRLPDAGGLPTGTMAANLGGALVLGAVLGWLGPRRHDPRWTPVTAGVLGATTTFSTFVVEVVDLWSTAPARSAAYLAGSVLVGLAAAVAGRRLAHAGRPVKPTVAGG